MAEIQCSVVVRGDAATLFDYLSSPGHRSPWQSNLLRRDRSTAEAADRSSWTEIRRFGARRLRVAVTVTESNRPNRIAYVGNSIGIRAEGELELHPHGESTLIAHRVQMHGHGLSAIIAPLVARRVRRILQADLFRITMRFAQIAV
jgi:hypothetical protein